MGEYKKSLEGTEEIETNDSEAEVEDPRDPDEVMDDELNDKITTLDAKTKKAKKKSS